MILHFVKTVIKLFYIMSRLVNNSARVARKQGDTVVGLALPPHIKKVPGWNSGCGLSLLSLSVLTVHVRSCNRLGTRYGKYGMDLKYPHLILSSNIL